MLKKNTDMSMRGGKTLLAYEEENLYASIDCYQEKDYLLVVEKADNIGWSLEHEKRYKTFEEAEDKLKEFIREYNLRKGDKNE